MNYFSWIEQEQELTNAALTVRAQAVPLDDTGRLFWDVFFPRQNVDSVILHQISGTADFRPVGDRREWNVRGRQYNTQTVDLSQLEMIPIETFFKVEEQEVQKLLERTLDVNSDLFRRLVRVSIPDRLDDLVLMNSRRIEMDAMQAWYAGTVTTMNPVTGGTATVSYGFDAGRYQTAATAWNNGAVNAYDEFIAWVEDGVDAMGQVPRGTVIRRATFAEIQKDAPQGLNATPLTRQQLADRVSQDLGFDFQFFVFEQSLDKYTDGGLATTRTKTWAAQKVALIPNNTVVGDTAFAPVGRAMALIGGAGATSEVDIRGMSAFREVTNGGRELTVEVQVNAFPRPAEVNLWVIDAGV